MKTVCEKIMIITVYSFEDAIIVYFKGFRVGNFCKILIIMKI